MTWARGTAAGRRRSSAPRRRVAGVGFPGVPGLILGCGLVQRNEGGVRNPLGVKPGFGVVQSVELVGNGGSGRRGSPA